MMADFTETGSVMLPYVCECGLAYAHAIAAAYCCDPAAPGPAD